MSKKHFIRLADYIRDMQGGAEPFTDGQLRQLAEFCREQNSNFNHERWIGYIKGTNGPSGGTVKGA